MNTPRQHEHHELEPLLAALAENTLSPTQRERLCEILRDDAQARAFYQRYIAVHVMLQWEASADEASDDPTGDLLHDLLLQEARAEAIDAPVWAAAEHAEPAKASSQSSADRVGARDIGQVLLYLSSRPRVWGPIAAIVALVVTLSIVISAIGPSTPSGPQTTQTPGGDQSPAVVATLTATHDAVWSEPSAESAAARGSALTPGTPLRAGDRLTLTAGFAEITTKDGAVAILEAPATIELLDNDNALHLHSGKLVGICETESSKGFTVHTPSASIIDLGTRFGVAHEDVTQTWVLEGQVSVSARHSNSVTTPTVLHAGMGAAVNQWAQSIVPVDTPAKHFYSQWEVIAQMPELSGQIHFEPSMPRSLYYGEFEREWVTLFRERSAVRLPVDLEVTIDSPGEHYALNTLESTLPAGTLVDSYLLHLDLPGKVKANSQRSATITFDRPILAVVSRSIQLAASDQVLGNPDVQYIKGNAVENKLGGVRGMEPATSKLEAIKISNDRRTLTIDMILVGESIDQARVLLEGK